MEGPQAGEPSEYIAERLREAIATEPDVHQLGIAVHLTDDRVRLTGSASTAAQRDAIGRLAERVAPGRSIVNDVEVPPMAPPTARDVEELD